MNSTTHSPAQSQEPEGWQRAALQWSLQEHTLLGRTLRYGLAVAAVAAGFGLRLAAEALVGGGLPTYITFYPAVMVVAVLAGFWPGIVATVLAGIGTAYWILPPVGQWAIGSPPDRLGLVIFAGMGMFMSAVAEAYRRDRQKAAAYDREAALREGRAQLAAFAAATYEGIVETEAGRIVGCNGQFGQALGYTVAELRGMEIATLFAPEVRDQVVTNIQQGRESEDERAMLRKDGARIIVEARGRPVSPGSPQRHTVIRDITARKQAEQALRESEQRFRLALKDSLVSVAIQDRNLVYQWAYTSDRRVRWLNDTIGKTDADLFGPEDLPGILEVKRGVLESGTQAHVQTWVTSAGRRLFLDLHYEPLRDSEGAITGIGIAAVNLTEQKRAEEALSESEERFRALVTASSEAIYRMSPEWSEMRQLHSSQNFLANTEGPSRDWLQRYIHPDDQRRVKAVIDEAVRTKSIFELAHRVVLADGTLGWTFSRAVPVLDAHGEIVEWFGAASNITERKRAEEALLASREELLKSYLELEQKVAERTQELARSLDTLQSEVETRKQTEEQLRDLSARLLRLQDEERRRIARELHDSTAQTLAALKMSLGQLERHVATVPEAETLCKEAGSLADQAGQEIRTVSYLLHPPLLDELGFACAASVFVEGFTTRSGIKTKLDLSPTVQLNRIAELALFRVLQESLTNVLRHSGSPSVEVRLYAEGENCVLTVRDFGEGIPVEKLANFNLTGAGVGVGLAGMLQRMRDLGGNLRVESNHAGTTVVASLPQKPASATAMPTSD